MHFVDKINDYNILFFMLFICIIILILLYYFLKNRMYREAKKAVINKNTIEGFTLKDIGKVAKDVKKVGTVANNLGKQVVALEKNVSKGVDQIEKTTTNITKQIDKKLSTFKDTVIKETNDLVVKKIENLFSGLGDVLYNGIIKPLQTLFIGLGDIFNQLFEILKKMGYKIVSLPGCILFYLINGTFSSILGFISWLTPSWIENPIAGIWNATFGKLLEWFLGVVGYTAASKKCYGFDVDEQIDNINSNFKKIGESFSKDFGKLNFKDIKV